jgi:hypothetical protein
MQAVESIGVGIAGIQTLEYDRAAASILCRHPYVFTLGSAEQRKFLWLIQKNKRAGEAPALCKYEI